MKIYAAMKVYIAGFFNTKDRLFPVRYLIKKMGHQVVARWLDEPRNLMATPTLIEYDPWFLRQCAIRDWADIERANLFILDTLDETPRGGREVELGIALTRRIPKWLVGPRRNVFHHLIAPRFETWEECLEYLRNAAK